MNDPVICVPFVYGTSRVPRLSFTMSVKSAAGGWIADESTGTAASSEWVVFRSLEEAACSDSSTERPWLRTGRRKA